MLRIGIVAGEPSGDMLGGLLMQALKNKRSDIEFVGIAGPKMIVVVERDRPPVRQAPWARARK